jgi:hypothetical protein
VDPPAHNYDRNNREQLYRFLNRHFDLDSPDEELPWLNEILTEAELNTGVPPDNQTLHSLARDCLVSIKKRRQRRSKLTPDRRQKAAARRKLREVIRPVSFDKVASREVGHRVVRRELEWQHRILRFDHSWSIPVTEFTSGRSRGVEIIVGDPGRKRMQQHVESALAGGRRALAADLFDSGECACDSRLSMVLASTGERALGIQVGQLNALIDWARRRFRCADVHLTAVGSVLPVVGLIASALEPERISFYHADRLMVSLHHLIDWPVPYDQAAPLFCFGLLAEFDLPDLVELAAPVPVFDHMRGPITR